MRRSLMVVLVALAAITGCGDDDAASPSPTAGPTSTAAPSDPAPPGAPAPDPGTSGDITECEAWAIQAGPAQARESFPDNPDNTWLATAAGVDEAGRPIVELVPTPDDVGYSRFRFVSECDGSEVTLLAGLALDSSGWILLFTTPGVDPDEFTP